MAGKDQQTFVAAIAARYEGRLRRFLSARVRNAEDVSDLSQEVFLRLMRVGNQESIRSPEAYLLTIASHVLHQHILRNATAKLEVDIEAAMAEVEPASNEDPLMRVHTTQRIEELERVLEGLPLRMSATLLLHRLAGFSIEEIAKQLGVARPTAKKYLALALIHCRDASKGQNEGPV